jgi:uncharacterized protein YbbK (DUF523 family)/uncharacterized protein YbgA (DUF1722 family)
VCSSDLVVVSRCLGFESCRYDGSTVECALVDELRPFVDFLPICAEVGAGLGIPRKQIRVVMSGNGPRLVEPETGMDRTDEVSRFSAKFVAGLDNIDGLILKSRSPSCAVKDAKLYLRVTDVAEVGRGAGLFARMAMAAFPGAAVEDEARLGDPSVREDFLTKLFTVARFRAARASGRLDDLRRFHVENRLLLVARNRRQTRDLDRLLTCAEVMPPADLVRGYEHGLIRTFRRPARPASDSRLLMQIVGQLGNRIGRRGRSRLLESLEDFRKGKVGLAVPRGIVRDWTARLEDEDTARRIYLEPYPHELVRKGSVG